MMNGPIELQVFEELRFILELLLAEHLFVYHFAKGKEKYKKYNIILGGVLVILALVYIPIINESEKSGVFVPYFFSPVWYIGLTLLSLLMLKLCYEITISDVLFLGIAAYCLQHIDYVLVNEMLAMGIFPDLPIYLPVYILVCIVTTCLLYFLVANLFAKKLRECEGVIYENQFSTITFFLVELILLFYSSFNCQTIFLNLDQGTGVNYLGAASDLINCMLVLLVQYTMFRMSALNREKEMIKQLLYERKKQYQMSKENMDIINYKCHDLKHQLHALKNVNNTEVQEYIAEVENSLNIYEQVVKTDNEVLNTVLSEKSLLCQSHNIRLSCMIDAKYVDFISTMDIYAILGNALDNAIECVSKYEDEKLKVISLNISANKGFLCIQTNNYFDGELEFKDGLPVTIKRKNKQNHGFGLKSIRHLAMKYGGNMYTTQKDNIFTLQIVLPMPEEFMRLLQEKEENNLRGGD